MVKTMEAENGGSNGRVQKTLWIFRVTPKSGQM
jgi:hypothetical protein